LTVLAALSQQCPEPFCQYYQQVMLICKQILAADDSPIDRALKAK